MRKFAAFIIEAARFTFTRRHWIDSAGPICISLALFVVDHALHLGSVYSIAAKLGAEYLLLVSFVMAWYRAVLTTGRVEIEYKLNRRTWRYLKALFKVAMIVILAVMAVFTIWAIVFGLPKSQGTLSPSWNLALFLMCAATMYLSARLQIMLPAAANDATMTLVEAWDASRSIQWLLLGTLIVVGAISGVAFGVLAWIHSPEAEYLNFFADGTRLILGYVVQSFIAVATAIAYKSVAQPQKQSSE